MTLRPSAAMSVHPVMSALCRIGGGS
jgi:hypothetical protein